jgi:hypothetical protein
MVLLAPRAGADLSSGESWSSGLSDGGRPNEGDLQSFSGGNPEGDENGDGTSNFVHYALAGSGPLHLPEMMLTAMGPVVRIYRNVLAGDALTGIEASADLDEWLPLEGATLLEEETQGGIRRQDWLLPGGSPGRFVRLKVTVR